MKACYLLLFSVFISFYGKTQTIEETAAQFWSAVDAQNDKEVVKNGSILIEYIDANNYALDTTIAEIRLYTALSYSKLGDVDKSLEINLKTEELIKLNWGKHPNYAMILNHIALDYSYLGDYSKSLEINLQVLEIQKEVWGTQHPDYARSLNNIALDFLYLGDLSKALEYNTNALKINELTLGKEHQYYAGSLNTYALIHSKLGNLSKSLEYNLQALVIFEKTLGKEHPNYATSLNNIASDYSDLGDYSKSLEINLQALVIQEKVLGTEHPDYARSMGNIAAVYSHLGIYSKSLEFNLEALVIFEKTLGKKHPNYAMILNNIAANYSDLGDYSKSLEINLQVLEIQKEVWGTQHPDYATSLNNIALDYYNMGNYAKSIESNLQVLEIRKEVWGTEHPDYGRSLNNIAANYYSTGEYESTSKFLVTSYTIYEKTYMNNQFGLDIRVLLIYKKRLEDKFFLNANFMTNQSTNSQFIATSWLNLNGLLASNQKNIEQEIISSGDSLAVAMMYELKRNKQQLHKYHELTLQEKQKRGIDEAALKEKIDAQERDLSQKSQSFANFNRYFNTGDVSNNLKSNEYFIDIVRTPHFNFTTKKWTDSTQYLVFIYSSQDTLVQYLFSQDGFGLEGDAIDNYKAFTSGEYRNEQSPDLLSYEHFWLPIAEKIGNPKTIYVSSNGIYNNINLNTLYNPTIGKYLIEEMDIRLVNSARDFILQKEKQEIKYNNNTIALFGYPNYNATNEPTEQTDLLAGTRDLATFWIDSLTRGGFTASLLPGTKKEVKAISDLFQPKKWEIQRYLEDEANETNIKALQQPRVLHIATHGYFFEDIPLNLESANQRFMGIERQTLVQDPMLRSGLLFAGANRTLKGEEQEGENGLLSAAEASLLNLRGTELVVLSACETGRGEVKNSEGVYGLRKAFTDAGARNLIMSLWKVDDAVTQEFMTLFYSIWLNDKKSIREAFNQTQLAIKAKYPQPYYWGAFILVGG